MKSIMRSLRILTKLQDISESQSRMASASVVFSNKCFNSVEVGELADGYIELWGKEYSEKEMAHKMFKLESKILGNFHLSEARTIVNLATAKAVRKSLIK